MHTYHVLRGNVDQQPFLHRGTAVMLWSGVDCVDSVTTGMRQSGEGFLTT